jgi:hypothetical protein
MRVLEGESGMCEECGVDGLDPVKDVCGDWIGTQDNGYECQDLICPGCRIEIDD